MANNYTKKAQLLSLFGLDSHVDAPVKEDVADYSEDVSVGRLRTDILQMMLRMPRNRHDRYTLLRDLDEGLAASVLDLYTEECTQPIRDTKPPSQVFIKSSNEAIEKEGNRVLKKFHIADNCQPFLRSIAIFGDVFFRLFFGREGIKHPYIVDIPENVKVEQDEYKRTVGYSQVGIEFDTNNKKVSNAWDYVHFANKMRNELLPYGTSILHNSYRSLRQMILTEDSVLLYRLLRHPDRIMHLIDTGTADEIDQRRILNRWVNDYRRRHHVNPAQKSYDFRHQTITPTEDIYVALGANSSTKLERLPGSSNAFDVHDLEYWINKFFGEVRVPKAFMGFEGDINKAATLTSQSIRFARAVISLQNVFKKGVRLLLQIHYRYISKGETDKTYDWNIPGKDFEVQMAFTSGLAELDWINLMLQRSSYAEAYSQYLDNPYIDKYQMLYYMFSSIFKLAEDDVHKILRKTPELPTPTGFPGMPATKALAKVGGRTGATPEEKDAARELVKLTPQNKFLEELIWYLQEIKDMEAASNSAQHTDMDTGDMKVPVNPHQKKT